MGIRVVATAYGGPEVLSVVEEAARPPEQGEVTIRVAAVGVNPIDYKLYSGAFGTDPERLPLPVGGELAGTVTAVGPGPGGESGGPGPAGPAGEIHVGDEVIAYRAPGAYASEITVSASVVVPKPPGLGWEQAAGLLLVGATSVHALAATGVSEGDTLLLHGASGGVGQILAQLAVRRGADVIGTASEAQHDLLREYGVRPVVYGPGLADRVRALAPEGVDVAIDSVGTDEAVDVSLELVADRNRIATLAAFQRGAEAGIKRLGGAPGADPGTEIRSQAWSEVVPLAAAGELKVVVSKTFPLREAKAAHEFVAAGHAGGKVVLLP
jgi:NADPH:quinone reductase-like Zn-dependent oxidoreductase